MIKPNNYEELRRGMEEQLLNGMNVPLLKIVRTVLKAKPMAYLIEASNPRHAHEWAVWRDGSGAVHPPIAYAKLQALADGAALASVRLWSREATHA